MWCSSVHYNLFVVWASFSPSPNQVCSKGDFCPQVRLQLPFTAALPRRFNKVNQWTDNMDRLYRDPHAPVEARIKDLLSRMTLKEKVGQMTQIERRVATTEVIRDFSIGEWVSSSSVTPILFLLFNILFMHSVYSIKIFWGEVVGSEFIWANARFSSGENHCSPVYARWISHASNLSHHQVKQNLH